MLCNIITKQQPFGEFWESWYFAPLTLSFMGLGWGATFWPKWIQPKIENILISLKLVQKGWNLVRVYSGQVSSERRCWRPVHCYHGDSRGPQRGKKMHFSQFFPLKFVFENFLKISSGCQWHKLAKSKNSSISVMFEAIWQGCMTTKFCCRRGG